AVAHVCALRQDNRLFCWGKTDSGRLGLGSDLQQPTVDSPAIVAGTGWTQVGAGFRHTCGIAGGTMSCWGDNNRGQLGQGTEENSFAATPLAITFAATGDGAWQSVSAGSFHTCGLRANSATNLLYCWGYNFKGQLGIGSSGESADATRPTAVPGGGRTWQK